MTNADQIREQQRQTWDTLSAAWDQHDAWFQRQSHSVTEWLCRVADLRGGQKVLDVACGSGQPAITAARLVKPGGSIVATDLSEEMLRVAKRKANMADLDNVEFKVMDAEKLEFEDASFDGVLCRWGLMYASDPQKAINEIYRVLKPNRPFATATFAAPDKNPYFVFTGRIAGEFLNAPPPPPDAPSPLRLNDTGRIKSMLEAAGFHNIEVEGRPMTFEFNSLDDFWRITSEFSPVLAQAMKTLDADKIAKMRAAMLEEASKYREGGKIRIPALALGAYAQK